METSSCELRSDILVTIRYGTPVDLVNASLIGKCFTNPCGPSEGEPDLTGESCLEAMGHLLILQALNWKQETNRRAKFYTM